MKSSALFVLAAAFALSACRGDADSASTKDANWEGLPPFDRPEVVEPMVVCDESRPDADDYKVHVEIFADGLIIQQSSTSAHYAVIRKDMSATPFTTRLVDAGITCIESRDSPAGYVVEILYAEAAGLVQVLQRSDAGHYAPLQFKLD